MSCEQHTEEV